MSRRKCGDGRAKTSRWRDARPKRVVARGAVARTLRSSGARRLGRGAAKRRRVPSRVGVRGAMRAGASRRRGLFDNVRSWGRRGRASPPIADEGTWPAVFRCGGVSRMSWGPGQLFSVSPARRGFARLCAGAKDGRDLASCSPLRGDIADRAAANEGRGDLASRSPFRRRVADCAAAQRRKRQPGDLASCFPFRRRVADCAAARWCEGRQGLGQRFSFARRLRHLSVGRRSRGASAEACGGPACSDVLMRAHGSSALTK